MSLKYLPEYAENARLALELAQKEMTHFAYTEKLGWVSNAEAFIGARKLRSLLAHKYMVDAKLFLEALQTADDATRMLMDVVDTMVQFAATLGLCNESKTKQTNDGPETAIR